MRLKIIDKLNGTWANGEDWKVKDCQEIELENKLWKRKGWRNMRVL